MTIAFATPRIYAALLCGVFLPGAQAQGQTDVQRRFPELNSASAVRHVLERGAAGSASMKVRRAFSGNVQKPVMPAGAGLQGSAGRKRAQQAGSTPETAVALTATRKGVLETVDGHAAASAPKLQSQRAASAGTKATFDPRAQMISPPNGAIVAPVQTFTWTAGYNVDSYWLWIGSCYDCTDILDENEGTNLARTTALPTDGRILYVTLFSSIGNNWYWIDYQFVASDNTVIPAVFISPAYGATLGNPQTFTWTAGSNIADYHLWVGSCMDCTDILDEDEGTNLSRTLNLPADGRTIFVTLFSWSQGNWYWYDYQFRASSVLPVRVNVTNQLGYSLNVFVNGALMGSVDPYNTQGVDVAVTSLGVSFELIRPTLSGQPLGDAFAGYFDNIDQPSGTYNFIVGNQLGSDYYFMPLISNHTNVPVDIEVNGGLQAENRCNCDAPAGSDNVATGYYQLFSNSNVRLFRAGYGYTGPYRYFGTDADGNVAPSGPLYKIVASGSGVLHLTLNTAP
jgi:hypothetical protein